MEQHSNTGSWLQEYHVRRDLIKLQTGLTILSLLLLVGSLGFALYAWYFAFVNYGPAAIWNWVRIPVMTAAVSLPMLFIFLDHWNRLSQIRVRIHTRGIQVQQRKKRISIPWEAISGIRTSSTRYGIGGLVWKKKDRLKLFSAGARREISLNDDIAHFEELVRTIKTNVYPRLGTEADRQLASGQAVNFGPIQPGKEALLVNKKAVPWDEVTAVGIQKGYLFLSVNDGKRTRNIRIATSRISNLDLCLQIIRQLSGL